MLKIILMSIASYGLSSLAIFGVVQASVVDGLYEARVEISDQLNRSRKKAETAAFKKVLVKVTGTKSVLKNPLVTQEFNKAANYLRSYSYDNDQNVLYYSAEFDRQRIERLITQNGFPLWDSRRPDTIIWLAQQQSDNAERQILSETNNIETSDIILNTAKDRGINVSLPLVDLTDMQALSIYDVWGGFSNVIKVASERYGTDYILSARVYFLTVENSIAVSQVAPLKNNSWIADWTLQNNSQIESGKLVAATQLNLTSNLIDLLADKLAIKYAIDTQLETPEIFSITVTNVNSLTQYAHLIDFLSSLSVVKRVSLTNQTGSFATFQLNLLGGLDDLNNALRLDDKIQPTLDDFGQPTEDSHYIWMQ